MAKAKGKYKRVVWKSVGGGYGYSVTRDGVLVAISDETQIQDTAKAAALEGDWQIAYDKRARGEFCPEGPSSPD